VKKAIGGYIKGQRKYNFAWIKIVLSKVSNFMLRVMRNRLHTKDNHANYGEIYLMLYCVGRCELLGYS